MADTTPSGAPPNNSGTVSESSCFQRTVSLYDWWLIKAENDFQGKRLAVAGFSSRKEEARRVFVSAPVIKRYDVFSLDTADGVYVIINGFINEQRTLENGFAPEVFNHFLFGFPPNWESYALGHFREESTAGVDLCNAVPDNGSAINPGILSDGVEKSFPTSLVSPEETSGDRGTPLPEDESNMSKEMGEVDVIYGSGGSRYSAQLRNVKVCQQKKPASGSSPEHPDNERSSTSVALDNHNLGTAVPDNVSAIRSGLSSDDMEKSNPTSLVSPEENSGDCETPLPEDESNKSKEMGGVDVVYGSGGNRRSARLRNVKVCQKKKPASGSSLKHPHNERSSISVALENHDSSTAVPDNISEIRPELLSDDMEKSIPTLVSPEEILGDHEKPFPEDECNISKEMGGVNVVYGSDRNRRSAWLHDVKFCQQKKPASGGSPKHPDNEQSSTSVALENHDSGTAVPDNISAIHPVLLSDDLEKSIPASLVSPEEALGDHKKSFPADESNISKEMDGTNVAKGSGGKRRSMRLQNSKVCQQKKQRASEGPSKHASKVHSSTSVFVEIDDGEPVTPIQSQSKGPVNMLSELLIKKPALRISGTLSPKTEGCFKKKRVAVKTKAVRPERKMTKSASAVKSPQARNISHLHKGSEQKMSSVSPTSSSLRKSRSGRLLLPPLEFWRNQIPVYNADHEVTGIQEGASLVSPCKVFSPSLSRFSNQKRAV